MSHQWLSNVNFLIKVKLLDFEFFRAQVHPRVAFQIASSCIIGIQPQKGNVPRDIEMIFFIQCDLRGCGYLKGFRKWLSMKQLDKTIWTCKCVVIKAAHLNGSNLCVCFV